MILSMTNWYLAQIDTWHCDEGDQGYVKDV